MKKLIISLGVIAGMLLLSGCGYDPLNRYVSFGNGKPYSTPYGTIYKISNPSLRHQMGINCPNGHAIWMEKRWFNSMRSKKPNRKQIKVFFKKAVYDGLVGCVPPLSNREYQYMLNQQNQRNANQRAANISSAIAAPKTYNINHSGSITHYTY